MRHVPHNICCHQNGAGTSKKIFSKKIFRKIFFSAQKFFFGPVGGVPWGPKGAKTVQMACRTAVNQSGNLKNLKNEYMWWTQLLIWTELWQKYGFFWLTGLFRPIFGLFWAYFWPKMAKSGRKFFFHFRTTRDTFRNDFEQKKILKIFRKKFFRPRPPALVRPLKPLYGLYGCSWPIFFFLLGLDLRTGGEIRLLWHLYSIPRSTPNPWKKISRIRSTDFSHQYRSPGWPEGGGGAGGRGGGGQIPLLFSKTFSW